MIVNGVRIQSFTDLLKWYHTIKSKKCDVALPFLFVSIIPHLLSFIHQRLSPSSLSMIALTLIIIVVRVFPLNLKWNIQCSTFVQQFHTVCIVLHCYR